MDDPHIDPAELYCTLEYLAKTNRRLGGTRAVIKQFKRWSADWQPNETIRILDIATGAADIPIALATWAAKQRLSVAIIAIDLHPVMVQYASEQTAPFENIHIEQLDALNLLDRFEPEDFDYVHAGLFLHHLEDMEVMMVLRMMERLATRGVLWNDIIRSPLTKLAIRPFAWCSPRTFRHDALASMDAGFTKDEALDLATRVGLSDVHYHSHWLHRFFLVSESEY